jgi:hypothetical protein
MMPNLLMMICARIQSGFPDVSRDTPDHARRLMCTEFTLYQPVLASNVAQES